MTTKSYAGLKAILMAKLESMTGIDDADLFDGVYGVAETECTGYPSAFVLEKLGDGHILDTHRNQREWQFRVLIEQEIGTKTPEQAYAALLDSVDRVIESFDQDPMLLDEHGESQCQWCRVVPVEFAWGADAGVKHIGILTIAIVDVVNRYA